MTDKHEWRKKEKDIYMPKAKPAVIDVPTFKYLTIKGHGSPAAGLFTSCIGALYPLAYIIKMHLKTLDAKPEGYQDFTVYPLEGVWDINEEAKKNFTGKVRKEDFVYTLMIRQPDFITEEFYAEMKERLRSNLKTKKTPNPFVEQVNFESIADGKCIQMLHVGPYDNEDETFNTMESYARKHDMTRLSKIHREIYLSDFRKTTPEKLKTTLRFQVR